MSPSDPPIVKLTPAGPQRVKIGDAVSVGCQATGRPQPKLNWRRAGSTLQLVTRVTDGVHFIEVSQGQ